MKRKERFFYLNFYQFELQFRKLQFRKTISAIVLFGRHRSVAQSRRIASQAQRGKVADESPSSVFPSTEIIWLPFALKWRRVVLTKQCFDRFIDFERSQDIGDVAMLPLHIITGDARKKWVIGALTFLSTQMVRFDETWGRTVELIGDGCQPCKLVSLRAPGQCEVSTGETPPFNCFFYNLGYRNTKII